MWPQGAGAAITEAEPGGAGGDRARMSIGPPGSITGAELWYNRSPDGFRLFAPPPPSFEVQYGVFVPRISSWGSHVKT